jgi:hypothetical protein
MSQCTKRKKKKKKTGTYRKLGVKKGVKVRFQANLFVLKRGVKSTEIKNFRVIKTLSILNFVITSQGFDVNNRLMKRKSRKFFR